MVAGERAFNFLAGISVLGWSIAGIRLDSPELGPVRLSVSCLNAVVGFLLISRGQERALAEPRAALLTIPSFLLCGLLFRWSQAEGASWSSFARWLFVVATGWTVVSLLCLGRSFAVIPSLRTVVTRGTYGWIRHPVYLGEMGLAGICAWATGHSGSGVLFMGVVIAVGWRIRVEEKFLSQESEEYSRYKEAVRWRLIPGAW